MTADNSGADDAPVEVELKYRMSAPAVGDRLLALDELAGLAARGLVRTLEIEDRYMDTPAGELAAAGYVARLRTGKGAMVLTLKGLKRLDDGGVVQRREELEGPAVEGLTAAAWPSSPARDAVLVIVGDAPLEEVLRIRQLRRKRDYGDDAAVVELSVDNVEVLRAGVVVERFAELEVELRRGDEAVLGPLADLLAEFEELIPASSSKLERSLEAIRLAPDETPVDVTPAVPAPRLVVGKTPGVSTDDRLAEAGRKVLRFHLSRMLLREAGTVEGVNPDELKAMRVATRRQRAAWRVFGSAFDETATAKHRRRLRAVAADLGAVRDLDVMIENVESYRAGLEPDEGGAMEPLLAVWRANHDAAREILLGELASRRYQRWAESYAVFVETEGAGVRAPGPVEPHRVRDTMPSRIWAAYETLRGYEPVMRWADITTLHDLRIAAKWLRYTLEFVREAMGPETTELIEHVVALQDHLGWLHDADVAAGLARAFLTTHTGSIADGEARAIGRYLADREHELARLRKSVGTTWQPLVAEPFRLMLGRVTASL